MKRSVLALVFLTFAAAPAVALERAEAESLFREANDIFRRANEAADRNSALAYDLYQRAALRYERIIREGGIRNGYLYYNLGNAYFRMNDLGRAILNYRRGRRLTPSDDNLAQNLGYARSRRLDRFDEKVEAQVLRTLLFWHYDLSPTVRTAVFGVFWAAFWIVAAARLRRPEFGSRTLVVSLGVVALMFFASLIAEETQAAGESFGVIIAEETVARRGDGESYQPAFTEPLHAGVEFTLLEERPGWREVELPDGRTCWIRAEDSELSGDL